MQNWIEKIKISLLFFYKSYHYKKVVFQPNLTIKVIYKKVVFLLVNICLLFFEFCLKLAFYILKKVLINRNN